MASASVRKAVSPRNIASVLASPGVNKSLSNALRSSVVGGSPNTHSFALLKQSPSVDINLRRNLTPCSESRKPLNVISPHVPRRCKSARKLPWSDGGDLALGTCSIAHTPLSNSDVLESITECIYDVLSVDSPNRSYMLSNFKQKKFQVNILGKGTYGTVVDALYKGKTVAAKIVTCTAASLRQMKNEMNCQELCHPNIVPIFKVVFPENNLPGLVIMEKVHGYSLQKVIDCDLFDDRIQKRLRYSIHISSALAYCHEHGILHLDVKPLNVMVDIFKDTCKLCDFGCSSQIGEEGTLVQGTVGYAAPEVLHGSKPTAAADVYSLAITMWQLVSRETPYAGQRAQAVLYKVVSAELRPELPPVTCPEDGLFLALVTKCWKQQPLLRPAIKEVLQELRHLEGM